MMDVNFVLIESKQMTWIKWDVELGACLIICVILNLGLFKS